MLSPIELMDIHYSMLTEEVGIHSFDKVGALFNQIHLIAINYHWALDAILDLKSQDRIEYALMIYDHLKAKYGADEDDFE